MLRSVLALFLVCSPSVLHADAGTAPLPDAAAPQVPLLESDPVLEAVRPSIPECEDGCITPSEAVAQAYAAGEGEPIPGRFLLDIRGGGRSLTGELEDLFFVNSKQGYARQGTLTVAFETDALWALLRRARTCGGNLQNGQIEVVGCRRTANADLTMFTMMQQLGNRRIVVDGDVRLVWIDAATGRPRPTANFRGEHELGYYQVWVRVHDADQVIFVYEE